MKRWTQKERDANTTWRLGALAQIEAWVWNNDQGPYDKVARAVVIRRFAKLESFVWAFFPDAAPAPFATWDAAALIVLPRYQALRLAEKLFRGGPGICKELEASDIDFNMDWFRPRDFK